MIISRLGKGQRVSRLAQKGVADIARFLRWSALQECMFTDPDDNRLKIWSEDHVSEDFQIAVTLQMKVSFLTRMAKYQAPRSTSSATDMQGLHHPLGVVCERRVRRRCLFDV